jgi:hypothetical protein
LHVADPALFDASEKANVLAQRLAKAITINGHTGVP